LSYAGRSMRPRGAASADRTSPLRPGVSTGDVRHYRDDPWPCQARDRAVLRRPERRAGGAKTNASTSGSSRRCWRCQATQVAATRKPYRS